MLAETSKLSVILNKGLDPDAIRGGEDYARCFASSLPQIPTGGASGAFPDSNPSDRRSPGARAPLLHYDGEALIPLPDQSFDHFHP